MPRSEFKKISVIGLGYIGLPTAAMFASRKIRVVGVDVNERAVETINRGEIHIVEPDLDIAVHAAVTEGYLRATTAAEPAEAFLIAVPTPFKGDDHEPDLSFIEAAARSIAPVLASGNLVVLESTSPVGATEQLAAWLAHARPDLTFPQTHGDASDIRIAHCPERVLPGRVMQELISNDRVIGGLTDRCSEMAVRLYRAFVKGECVVTNARTAEMAKLTENSFRDVNIAFANELSIICEKLDIDVWELISLANRHPRVNILQPGPGVGGHCIAVDPWFIVSKTPEEAKLIRSARLVNEAKLAWTIESIQRLIRRYCSQSPSAKERKPTIVLYGLTFKANVDDLRESPAITVAETLLNNASIRVQVVEPHIDMLPASLLGAELIDIGMSESADLHVLLVDHASFANAKPKSEWLLDFRGAWR
ncbi:MAG: UDP-N-acetyl-D-mannosamine dehydrogenase [Pseudomonadales bacterium]|nr:UDP-N-acetyl-D-mannosamine dehydrogenase [Pseudomonadales bacterium]